MNRLTSIGHKIYDEIVFKVIKYIRREKIINIKKLLVLKSIFFNKIKIIMKKKTINSSH